MIEPMTFFECSAVLGDAVGFEARWCLGLVADQEAELAEMHRDEDERERLAGRCECCQEWPDTGLMVDGGDAVCDGCRNEDQ